MKYKSITDQTEQFWHSAIMQLRGYESNGLLGWVYTKNFNPKPLATMLLATQNPPQHIIEFIAHLMLGAANLPRMKFSAPKNQKKFKELMANLTEMRSARAEFSELRKTGETRQRAIGYLTEKNKKKSDTWVETALTLDDDLYLKCIIDGALPDSVKRRKKRRVLRQNSKMSAVIS